MASFAPLLLISVMTAPALTETGNAPAMQPTASAPVEPEGRREDGDDDQRVAEGLRDLAEAVRSLKQQADPWYQEPCSEGGKDPHSDLCAQWTAAEAAQAGAGWTKWGFVASVLGLLGLITNLFYTARTARSAAEAADTAVKSVRESARSLTESREANRIASEGLALLMTEFNERMRPRCVVTGIRLAQGWQEVVAVGGPLPVNNDVINIGGTTGRRPVIHIDAIEVFDEGG